MASQWYVYSLANTLKLDTYGNELNDNGTKLYCAPMSKQVANQAIRCKIVGNWWWDQWKSPQEHGRGFETNEFDAVAVTLEWPTNKQTNKHKRERAKPTLASMAMLSP
jgi:hypothetical protein